MWFEIEESSKFVNVKKRLPTRIYDFVFRFFSAFLLGSVLAGVYYGIDYWGKKSVGVEIGEDFWLSVFLIVGFFSLAWANLAIFRTTYFVFDSGASEIKIFQKWIFGGASAQEIPYEHVKSLEVHSGVNPSLTVIFDEGSYNLFGHISVPALNEIIDAIEKTTPPFALKRL